VSSPWSFKKNILFNNDQEFIILSSDIKKILIKDDSIVILVNPDNSVGDRNVLCYSQSKILKWQIPKPLNIGHSENDFTGIYFIDENFYAYNRNGIEHCIDVNNGKILNSQLIK